MDIAELMRNMKETSAAIAAMTKSVGEKDTKLDELRARILELEQKGAPKRGGGLGGEHVSNASAIVSALEKEADFGRILEGTARSVAIRTPLRLKTAIVSSSAIVMPDRDGAIIGANEQRLTIRDLIPVIPTTAGSVEFTQETTFTNNAGVQFSSPNDTENVLKNESGLTFQLVSVPVKTIAHWIPASRQVLADRAELMSFVENRLLYGLKLEEEDQVLLGDGTGGNISGLLTNANAYNRSVSNDTWLDTLRKAITQLQLANAAPTGVVLHPGDWERIELLKDTTGQYLTVNTNRDGREVCWRIPVVASNSMTQGQFLMGDFQRGALIRDREEARVEVSREHSDYFTRNMVAILAEERIALTVVRPASFVKGSWPTN